MVIERVKIVWNGVSSHLVPELPSSVEERIRYALQDWEILKRTNDITLIKSKTQKASFISDKEETRAMCQGYYGGNSDSIKDLGKAIKKVAEIAKMDSVLTALRENNCGVAIICDALPNKVNPIYDVVYTANSEKNITVAGFFGNYYDFSSSFYDHVYSKKFEFP